jgi:processive 1,2-diacylglycerol beta-glucosyltransferase
LIVASDLVVGKAGGLTVSEVLGRGVPLIIPTPVPGQEQWNAAHVVQGGAGLCRETAEDVAQAVTSLLHDHAQRRTMAEAARALGQPTAALAIAGKVLADMTCGYRPVQRCPTGLTLGHT